MRYRGNKICPDERTDERGGRTARKPKTDVTLAIFSRDFVAQLYRATKSRDKVAGVTSV